MKTVRLILFIPLTLPSPATATPLILVLSNYGVVTLLTFSYLLFPQDHGAAPILRSQSSPGECLRQNPLGYGKERKRQILADRTPETNGDLDDDGDDG